MAKQKPTDVLPGYALLADGDAVPEAGIFIPLTTLTGLDVDNADPVTGSGATVLYEITKVSEASFNAIPEETRTPVLTLDRGIPTGLDVDSISVAYTNTYTLGINGALIDAET